MGGKDYAGWHAEKLLLNSLTKVPYCHEREIWWAKVGCNIGYEEDGKGARFVRPVLIIKKFNQWFVLGAPLSTTARNSPYHYHLNHPQAKTVLISQIRTMDTRRLQDRLGSISKSDFIAVKAAVKDML